MNFYQILVNFYDQVLAIFPPPLQWLITLVIIIGLVSFFFGLIRHDLLFIILLVVLLPFMLPVIVHFVRDIYQFFLFLVHQLGVTAPN